MTLAPFYEKDGIAIYCGDCLDVMPQLEGPFDAIVADLPYGTTACDWDIIIPFEPLWKQYERLTTGAVVLFGSQPFTSALVKSNLAWFKYCWVWDKVNLYTGALQASRRPLRRHEDIVVFAVGRTIYNKQFRRGRPYSMTRNVRGVGEYQNNSYERTRTINEGWHNPCSILQIKGDVKSEKGFHPTQKPVALLRYLVRTYTNPGDIVLDNVMGSGTTLVAAQQLGRRAVGIEISEDYCEIAVERLRQKSLWQAVVPTSPRPKQDEMNLVDQVS